MCCVLVTGLLLLLLLWLLLMFLLLVVALLPLAAACLCCHICSGRCRRPPLSPAPPHPTLQRLPPVPPPRIPLAQTCAEDGSDDVCNPFVGATWSSAAAAYHFYLYDETPDGTDLRLWEWPRVTPTDDQLANNGICAPLATRSKH